MNIVRASGISALLLCLLSKSAQADGQGRTANLIPGPDLGPRQGPSVTEMIRHDVVTSIRPDDVIGSVDLASTPSLRLHLDGLSYMPVKGPRPDAKSYPAVQLVMQLSF